MNLPEAISEFQREGALLVKKCIGLEKFDTLNGILKDEWDEFITDSNPFNPECAKFAKKNPEVVSKIYNNLADLIECTELVRQTDIRNILTSLLGEGTKIYGKIPLRIDVPHETKELAVWHQVDFSLRGS